jgi:hypothetical protein
MVNEGRPNLIDLQGYYMPAETDTRLTSDLGLTQNQIESRYRNPRMQDYYAARGKKGFIDRNLTRNPFFDRYDLKEADELVNPAAQTVVNDYLLSPFNAGKAAVGMGYDFLTQQGNAGPGRPLNIPYRIATAVKDLVTFFSNLSQKKPGTTKTPSYTPEYGTKVKDLMSKAKSNKEKM